jgi:hypothetical protein
VHEIAMVIGRERALQLVEKFGGKRLYIPRTMTSEHKIALAIGLEGARLLAAASHLHGVRDLPECASIRKAEEVRLLRRQGKSYPEIAVLTKLTVAGVRKILWRAKKAARSGMGGPVTHSRAP